MTDSTLRASATGASFLILLQLLSRGLTFAINQVLLRYLSPSLLGASAQLDLLGGLILYFSRESLRVASQRQRDNVQVVVNLAYLAIALGTIIGTGLVPCVLPQDGEKISSRSPSDALSSLPHVRESFWITGAAAVVELMTEPAFAATQYLLLYRERALAESAGSIAKCIVTCGITIWASTRGRNSGLLPFAGGQMGYSCALLLVYVVRMRPVATENNFSLFLSKIKPHRDASRSGRTYSFNLFSRPLIRLSMGMALQSGLKYLLTQGDALLVLSLTSLSAQGSYALASNYGSLVARLIFQPIEESCRNLFAKLCAPSAETANDANAKNVKSNSGKPGRSKASVRQARVIMSTVLHLYAIIALPMVTFGPYLARPLLALIAGPRWSSTTSEAANVLAAYTWYIPVLAVNGITEAFVAAVAEARDLRHQSGALMACSLVFAGTAWVLVTKADMAAVGIVWASVVNMAGRSMWNSWFVSQFFGKETGESFAFAKVLPSPYSIGVTAIVPPLLRAVQGANALSGSGVIKDLARIGGLAAVYCLILAFLERQFLLDTYRMIRPPAQAEQNKVDSRLK